jgi:hypothetical protein
MGYTHRSVSLTLAEHRWLTLPPVAAFAYASDIIGAGPDERMLRPFPKKSYQKHS